MEPGRAEAEDSPASNHETGSLTQSTPHESRFIGSSSGVYFINTVKQAFEASGYHHLPAAEDTVGGDDDFTPSQRNSPERSREYVLNLGHERDVEVHSSFELGSLPSFEAAQALAIAYFRQWHPIMPFLSGPDFLQDLAALYQDPRTFNSSGRFFADRKRVCQLVILQCVLTMGASCSENGGPRPAPISRSSLLSLVASLASRNDTLTIQTALAAELYCVSIMALRTASTLGGLLAKMIYHAGLHRCPYRYPQLTNDDRELRKRIFWSSYALDRYLSQSLGIPVSLPDSEIDVCVSGRKEVHEPARSDIRGMPILPDPIGASGNDQEDRMDDQQTPASPTASQNLSENASREVILANFVEYGTLVGRSLDIFHVSLHSRQQDPRRVLFLRSDVDKWFNGLPEEPRPENPGDSQISRFLPFLHVLYEQLIISINRPSLSLSRSAPEFHHGLQVTIRAAKRTIIALERQRHLFWPGYLASVWMSGLIISFACQVGLYSIDLGSQEILRCLDLLRRLSERWGSAQRCYAALSTLLSDLQRTKRRPRADSNADSDSSLYGAKRRRYGDLETEGPLPPARTPSAGPVAPAWDPRAAAMMGDNAMYQAPMGTNFEWDVDDFFKDLSWENLFDVGDMRFVG